jgi:cyclophilin family peptidyl-prolyl cis-trans isomerase
MLQNHLTSRTTRRTALLLLFTLALAPALARTRPAGGGGGGGDKKKQGAAQKKTPVNTPGPYVPPTPGPRVVMETNQGKITLELYPDKAPKTVANFLDYVDKGLYNNTFFSRVLPTFMIQGGLYDADGVAKEVGPPIPNESNAEVQNRRGTIAMARYEDKPDSATAEFFINVVDNRVLDKDIARDGYGYCVFGRVVDGLDTVDRIRRARTQRKSLLFSEWPQQTILLRSIKRVEPGPAGTAPAEIAAPAAVPPTGATIPNETPAVTPSPGN